MVQKELSRERVRVSGRGIVESPRWHGGRFWFADWTSGEILSLGDVGAAKVAARASAPPLSFDFGADGHLLIVSSATGELLSQGPDGKVEVFARLGAPGPWNEIVVDGRGTAYVNGPELLRIMADGRVFSEARDFEFPNGMAVTPDNRTLIVAESHGRRLTAFDIGVDGRLSKRRIWAPLEGPPDGICVDETGAAWYADVPNARCVRVREGGEILDRIELDRGAFACMLGGPRRRTLMVTTARWFGMERMKESAGTGQVVTIQVDHGGAGWP